MNLGNQIEERAVLDRIISTLHYCRLQYKPLVMSVAGVGVGATIALNACCDLQSLASHALLALSFPKTMNNMNNSEPTYCLGYAKKVVDKRQFHWKTSNSVDSSTATAEQKSQSQQSISSSPEIYHIDDIILETTNPLSDDDNQADETTSFEFSEQEKAELLNNLVSSSSSSSPSSDSTHSIPSDSESDVIASPIPDSKTKNTKKKTVVEKQKDREIQQQKDNDVMSKMMQTRLSRLQSSSRSVTEKGLLPNSNPSLDLTDLVYLCPRVLLCLTPMLLPPSQRNQNIMKNEKTFEETITSLQLPVAVIYSGDEINR